MDLEKRLEGEERGDRDIEGRYKCLRQGEGLCTGIAQQESSWTRLMFAMEYTGREKLMVLL